MRSKQLRPAIRLDPLSAMRTTPSATTSSPVGTGVTLLPNFRAAMQLDPGRRGTHPLLASRRPRYAEIAAEAGPEGYNMKVESFIARFRTCNWRPGDSDPQHFGECQAPWRECSYLSGAGGLV
jgi:hypothetical protein